jgi:peptide/nickel transport system permease protein
MTIDAAVTEPPPAGGPRRAIRREPSRRYILIRFLLIFPTVLILVTLVFFLIRLTGDPITAALGGRLPGRSAGRAHPRGRLRPPIFVQYVEYLGQIFTFDFGTTITDNQPVVQVLATYGTATLELVLYSLVVAFIVGIPLGMVAAALRDRWPDACCA